RERERERERERDGAELLDSPGSMFLLLILDGNVPEGVRFNREVCVSVCVCPLSSAVRGHTHTHTHTHTLHTLRSAFKARSSSHSQSEILMECFILPPIFVSPRKALIHN